LGIGKDNDDIFQVCQIKLMEVFYYLAQTPQLEGNSKDVLGITTYLGNTTFCILARVVFLKLCQLVAHKSPF